MKKKILITFTVLMLVILPFLIGSAIGSCTPYVEGNSFRTYVIIWFAISIAIVSLVWLLLKKFSQSFERKLIAVPLFLLVCPTIGIIGLVEPPDLSLKMLEHPEREHLRYIFLFISALLLGVFTSMLQLSNSLKMKQPARWIVTIVFSLALIEFLWEFTHHYLYPEGLKEWLAQGNSFDEFARNYDSTTILNIGAFGRFIQFPLIIWLSLRLYMLRQIKIWSPILLLFFSVLGIASATIVYTNGFPFPKGFEFLLIFFIPGIPFVLLYWLGVAMLTNSRKVQLQHEKKTSDSMRKSSWVST